MSKRKVKKFDPSDHGFIEWYGSLFLNSKRNQQTIVKYLRTQVQGRARFFTFPPSSRADVMQEATLKVMSKIQNFDPAMGNPISFFDEIINNSFKREIGRIRRHAKRNVSIEDGAEPSGCGRPDGLASARKARKVDERTPPCPKLMRKLKERIKNAIQIFNRAIECEKRDLQIIVATLQDVFRDLAGVYVPIRSEGIRYTEERRLDNIGEL